eukprot:13125128-Ditylum_brightwellii.AAC.1
MKGLRKGSRSRKYLHCKAIVKSDFVQPKETATVKKVPKGGKKKVEYVFGHDSFECTVGKQ